MLGTASPWNSAPNRTRLPSMIAAQSAQHVRAGFLVKKTRM